jgi:hypothetical protein
MLIKKFKFRVNPTKLRKAFGLPYNFEDPLNFASNLTEEELMVRKTFNLRSKKKLINSLKRPCCRLSTK